MGTPWGPHRPMGWGPNTKNGKDAAIANLFEDIFIAVISSRKLTTQLFRAGHGRWPSKTLHIIM